MVAAPVVLLTNDDGYGACGLEVLRSALIDAGMRVIVVAPELNHTAGSHRVTLAKLEVRRLGEDRYVCTGTPADCVRWGVLSGTVPPPDVVAAGLNHGANAGEDVLYSGTVAAAREGAMLGVPALAASQDGDGPPLPFLAKRPSAFPDARYVAHVIVWLAANGAPIQTFVNLNLPREAMVGPAVTATVGARDWPAAGLTQVEWSPGRFAVDPWAEPPRAVATPGSDFDLLGRGYATLSVLRAGAPHAHTDDRHLAWAASLPTLVPSREYGDRPLED